MDSQLTIRSYREAAGVKLDDLAARLGVNKSTLWRWEEGQVPAERVLDVERMTGVSRHSLRPDVFGPEPQPSEAAE